MQESNDQAVTFYINDQAFRAEFGQTILNAATSQQYAIPSICYHPNLGSIQTCDTCHVGVDGKLVRSCNTPVTEGMRVDTRSKWVREAQYEAMSRILKNHELYCTVCDNNNGNCVVHNTAELLEIEHQKYQFEAKPYPPDNSHPFYRYEPDQCILCGRCVEACQDLQVNETLSIDWQREVPRVIWDNDVLEDGSLIRLTSPYGEVEVRALVTDNVTGNEIYLTMNSPEERKAVNRLTSSYHDKITHTPNYKEMSVKLKVIERTGEPPLPRVNHRFGNRQPQIGVKVDEKWSRPGFVPIAELFEGGEVHGESHPVH